MDKAKLSAERIEAGLRDLAECNKLIDQASKEAILDNKSTIKETPAFIEAKGLVVRTCADLGIPVPAFFRDGVPPIYH